MRRAEIRILCSLSIAIWGGGLATLCAAQALPRLVAVKVSQLPILDGAGDDPAWREARPVDVVVKGVMPKTKGTATRAQLRAVYTDQDLYLLVTWEDATRDDKAHKPWVWNQSKGAYEEGAEREDMLGVAFEHTGPFTGDMLAGVDAVWDVWHWKATRTNPQGYAMDRTHRFSSSQPGYKANKHKANDGADTWIARPEDRGNTVEIKQPAPKEYQGERVPQYLPGTPTDSAADVRAKGAWSNGRWTVELQRRLLTGHDDDSQFEPGRRYKMAISTHDHSGDMDKASEVVELSFASD